MLRPRAFPVKGARLGPRDRFRFESISPEARTFQCLPEPVEGPKYLKRSAPQIFARVAGSTGLFRDQRGLGQPLPRPVDEWFQHRVDQGHLIVSPCQHAAKITANAAGAHHRYLHGAIFMEAIL